MPSSSRCAPVRRLVTVIRAGQPAARRAGRFGRSVRPTLMLICRSSKKPPLGPTGAEWARCSSRAADPRDRVAAALAASSTAPPLLKRQPGPRIALHASSRPAPAAAAAPSASGSATCSSFGRRQPLDLLGGGIALADPAGAAAGEQQQRQRPGARINSPSAPALRGGCARPRGTRPSSGWWSSSRRACATPRAVMQAWLASITTATPCGWRCSQMQSATWAVSRSCTCSRRAKPCSTRASLEMPTTRSRRQIGDRRLADDRRQMVLAMRLERDVLQQHDLVIAADLLEGAAEMVRRILGIAARIFLPGARDPRRRVEQALAVGIVARPADQGAHRLLDVVGHGDLARLADQIAVFGVAAAPVISPPLATATGRTCEPN